MSRRRRPWQVSLATAILTVAAFFAVMTIGYQVASGLWLAIVALFFLIGVPMMLLGGSSGARLATWGFTGLVVLRALVGLSGADSSAYGHMWRMRAGYFSLASWVDVLLLLTASVLLATPSSNAFFRAPPRINPKIWN